MANSRSLQQAVRLALAAVTTAAGVSTLHAQTAPAQAETTPAPTISEVVVTGSRLQTPNETSISPITTVSATDVQATGLTRVEDILNNLPMVFAGMNSTTSNGNDGTATVDLRGLGNQRTLVLVNGLRLGPGSGLGGRNYSDINEIPTALIERVDVLTGGASAVYGADAVAGVVNFVLNTHFEGVKIDAGYHFNQHDNTDQDHVAQYVTAAGDPLPPSSVNTGFGKYASVVMGSNFSDNKGNVTAYVTYDNQGAALQSQFDYSACTLGIASNVPPYSLFCAGSTTSAKAGAGGRFLAFSSSGVPLFDNTVDGKTGIFRPFTAADEYNYGPLNYYQVPNERWTAGTFANYDVNSHINVYTQIMLMRNDNQAQIAPSGDFGDFSNFIPCADPLLTAQEASVICSAANRAAQGNPVESYNGVNYPGLIMEIRRRNVEGGPRIADYTTDSQREVLGIKGDFGDSRDAWTYNASIQHSSVDTTLSNENYFSYPNLQQALNVLPGTSGPVCGTGPTSLSAPNGGFTPNPACVPYNVWNANAVNAAQLAFLSVPLLDNATTSEYLASGSITGDLSKYGAQTPWADAGLQVNVGAEYRQDSSSALPDYLSQQGGAAGGGGPTPPIAGGFHVSEMFTELRLPIASHQFMAEDLSIEGGYRYSSYTEGFDTSTYKLGLEWAPVKDLRVRGSYQRAVRAPNIGELYSPQSVGLDGSIDPCAVQTIGQTPAASLAACEATGVKPNQYGKILANSANQYNGLLGGNPNLQPEVADTYTVGLVLTPRVIPNLSVSLDYFNIRINGVISPIGANTILLDCLSTLTEFCNDIHRDSTGSLWLSEQGYVIDTTVNEGQLKTAGVDLKASYRQPLPALGSLLFSLEGTRLQTLQTTPVPGGASYDCFDLYGPTCGVNARWRSVFNATWSTPWDGLDVTLRWRYFGSTNSESASGNPLLSSTSFYPPLAHIPAYSWIDLSASFNLYKNIKLQLGVNNLFDKAPPIVPSDADCSTGSPAGANCNGNTYPGVYDALGRYLFMHITAQF